MFWCFLHMYHLYEFLSTSLKIRVKYTEHKIDHFNHFWVDSPVVVSTFTLLYNRHHHPPPEFFSSSQTETLQIFNVLDYMMSSHRASQEKDDFPSYYGEHAFPLHWTSYFIYSCTLFSNLLLMFWFSLVLDQYQHISFIFKEVIHKSKTQK